MIFIQYLFLQSNEPDQPPTSSVNTTNDTEEIEVSTQQVLIDVSCDSPLTDVIPFVDISEPSSPVSNTIQEPTSINGGFSTELHISEPTISYEHKEHIVDGSGDHSDFKPKNGAASSKPVPDITISEDNTESVGM